MAKKLDMSKSVYELVNQYPELVGILEGLGFKEITKPAMLNSVGKVMTIPKGAKMKKISMLKVVPALMSEGFELSGKMPAFAMFGKKGDEVAAEGNSRNDLLKSYLKRLGEGEELEAVRADFVENFQDVEAAEIMKAEQELMKEGTPLEEVQRLCDIHSALFHGSTREEQIANAEREVAASVKRQELAGDEVRVAEAAKKRELSLQERTDGFASVAGHPLGVLQRENEALEKLIAEIRAKAAERKVEVKDLKKMREVATHYAKKGDLIYPQLASKYDVTGPSNVMWTVDIEIRNALGWLVKAPSDSDSWYEDLEDMLKRAEEMIYKEKNILFPVAVDNFTKEDWYGVYRDARDYAVVFGVKPGVWMEAERYLANEADEGATKAGDGTATGRGSGTGLAGVPVDGVIKMPGGSMTVEQLTAMLNTIPMEISFIDANDINRYFNEGPKEFKRPLSAIGREVYFCHPPKVEPIVRNILESFKDNSVDSVPVWMEKNGKTMYITYTAVRDRNEKYLGAIELVQDMEFAREHFERQKDLKSRG